MLLTEAGRLLSSLWLASRFWTMLFLFCNGPRPFVAPCDREGLDQKLTVFYEKQEGGRMFQDVNFALTQHRITTISNTEWLLSPSAGNLLLLGLPLAGGPTAAP